MTTRLNSVLVAVDFSDASARAVAVAGAIVHAVGATRLHLVHAEALEAPAYFTSDQLSALEHQRQAIRTQAEQFLARFGRRHTTMPLTVALDDRPPADAILHHALTADLVVMGTHGRHGPRRWWLGSVAERVLRHVTRPLFIVRASAASPAAIFDRILVHASGSLVGADALRLAHELAAAFGGNVADARHERIEPLLERTRPTVVIEAAPEPRTTTWLSHDGEPLVRHSPLPILFVPESAAETRKEHSP